MPQSRLKKISRKKLLVVLFILLLLVIGLYLNRSYARIFEHNDNHLPTLIQPSYVLSEGSGTGTLKYVALGDSLTYGYGASDYKTTFPYIIARNFLNHYRTVQVNNFALPGAVSEDVLVSQLPKAIVINPDYITLMIGTNDVHDYVEEDEFKSNMNTILTRLQEETEADILLINIPYLGTENLILPPFNVFMDTRIKQYNKILNDIADSKDVKYFDLYNASYAPFKNNPGLYYSYDKFHPSSEGYILWGDLIDGN